MTSTAQLFLKAADQLAGPSIMEAFSATLGIELRRQIEAWEDRLEAPGLLRLHREALAESGELISVDQILAEFGTDLPTRF